ncbi:MAG: nucleotidyltransferase family protein [Porphyromonadaceae bacterium]|nr:nucleotidyltransferase family protein [Porphyromonadaceae bacterium]MBF1373283.1 nucleotidyltransferase family protein [Porphyromonadaceae bacterium]
MSQIAPLSHDEELFLKLLSCALHSELPEARDFTGLEEASWRRIHRLAASHAVPAFVGDRILTLPKEALPNRDMRLMIFSEIELTRRGNAYLTKALGQLQKTYEAAGLPFILLKGLSLGCFYPDAALRSGGDLDILFHSDADYERGNELLRKAGHKLHDDSEVRYGHTAFTYGRTIVENHARAVFFDHKRHNRRFDALIQEAISSGSLITQHHGDYTIQTLPHELNVVYIFIHLFFHWLHWGVGFRQYSDWLLMMTRLKGQLDEEKILSMAKDLDILYPMQLFAQAAIRYLRVSPEIFPFPLLSEDDPHTEQIIRDVMHSGNFGFAQRPIKAQNKWVTNWRKFRFKMRRSRRLYAITPTHASRIIWGSVFGHLMLMIRRRR